MLAVPHRGSVMNKPDSPGGPVKLFVIGKNGNVGFPPGFSRTGNLLFGLRKQSQSVGHSDACVCVSGVPASDTHRIS